MDLYTLETGKPGQPAVVLLHGGGLSSKMWQPAIDMLPEFHILAPDLPEQGQSQAVAPFTLEDAAQRVSDLIRQRVPGGKAHVVGLSLGGAVVLTLLRLAPEVVDRALVTGTAAVLDRWLGRLSLASLWMLRLYKVDTLAEMTLKQQGIPAQYRELAFPDLAATATESFNRTTIQALMDMELPLQNSRPLLAVVGSKETPAAKQAARKLVRTLPNTSGAMVPGLNHVWPLQDPGLFCRVLRAWTSGAPLPEELSRLNTP
jgi:pimeloyl-ACP methyl ester carboxylesterase